MKTLWIVNGWVMRYEPIEMIGIFDSEDKAQEAKKKAESAKTSWGSRRFEEVWLTEHNVNEIMDLNDL